MNIDYFAKKSRSEKRISYLLLALASCFAISFRLRLQRDDRYIIEDIELKLGIVVPLHLYL